MRRAALRWTPTTFRALGHRLVDQIAGYPRIGAARSGDAQRIAAAVREALDLTGPLPESGMDPAPLLERTRTAAVRSLAVQRTPALLRVHHRVAGADRDSRRLSRLGGEPERRRLDAVAGRHRDRVADGAMDRRVHRLPARLRRAARQRRQHGELRLLPRGARGEGRLGMSASTASPDCRTQAPRLHARPKRTRGFRRPPT